MCRVNFREARDTMVVQIGAKNVVGGGTRYFPFNSMTTITSNGQTTTSTGPNLAAANTFTYSCSYIDAGGQTNSVFCLYGDTALVSSDTWQVWLQTVNVDVVQLPGPVTGGNTVVQTSP
jgi:hypothetical protein